MSWRRVVVLLVVGWSAWSCEERTPTQVLVRFHAGPRTAERASRFGFHVPNGTPADGAVDVGDGVDFPFTIPIVPEGGDVSRPREIVGFVEDEDGIRINVERVVFEFEPDRLREVAVCFDDRCLDEPPCGEGSTCAQGQCVDARVDPRPASGASPCAGGEPTDGGPDGAADGATDAAQDSDAGECDDPCPEAPRITEVVAGAAFTAAIDVDGELWTWGSNDQSRLGQGASADAFVPVPTRVMSGVATVDAGTEHACAARDGRILCWGGNGSSRLGIAGDEATPVATPTELDLQPADWLAVAAGAEHTCALRATGTVRCWGANESGQLGRGTTQSSESPPTVDCDGIWRQVSTGRRHTCGIDSADNLHCWGANTSGQLGLGAHDSDPHALPQRVGGANQFWGLVTAGYNHTCAIRRDQQTLSCWGSNEWGQIGTTEGEVSGRITSPAEVLGASFDWISVSAGWYHTCAVRENGALWCWGRNQYGQLGIGSEDQSPHADPVRIGDRWSWQRASAGLDHSCATTRCGELYCWGANASGQLGSGETAPSNAPVRVCWRPD